MPTTTDGWLVDTNVLPRWALVEHHDHRLVAMATDVLREYANPLYVAPQNLAEFWNVATRPANVNGFGQTPEWADEALSRIEAYFYLAEDTPSIYRVWRRMVVEYGVSGVQVHDARIAAAMQVHGLTHILSFNTRHFGRYHHVQAVHPEEIQNQRAGD